MRRPRGSARCPAPSLPAVLLGRGAVHATEQGLQNPADEDVRRFGAEPATPGSVEHTLDRVRHRN
ncbi:hypothetical protein ACVW19_006704 [Streptomyces sp. TE5632]